jgi:tetratricopeptide (TPR) repeat protein
VSANATQERMRLGHAARKAGRTAEALAHYRSALDAEPDSAEANSVYGLMLLQLGRAGEAEAPLRRAVEIAPSHAAFRMNLARWLEQQQRLDEAVDVVAGIVADEPRQHWAHERLGELKARQRQFGEAAALFAKACELQPGDPSLLFKWARATFDDGKIAEAERILAEAAPLAPRNAAIHRLAADILESRGDWEALERRARDWIGDFGREPAPWRAFAKAQLETGYYLQAKQNFAHALNLGERDARNLSTYARICINALDFESASRALAEAEAINPDAPHLLSSQAVFHMLSGRYEEAEAYARRALAASPNDPAAYKALVELTNGRLSRAETGALAALVDREGARLVDRVTAAFALAGVREAEGDAASAITAYEQANRLAREQGRAEGLAFDRSARSKQFVVIISRFPDLPGAPSGDGVVPRPVFIVGMPRSGTTLVESVIGAHSKALAAGERMPMRWIVPEYLARASEGGVTAEHLDAWHRLYWQGLPERHGATVVTDKNPWNFDAIGVIARLFPAARVIRVRRSPVETGLSIWRNQFAKGAQYTNSLEDIAHYYGEYARLMAHWGRAAPGRFTTIQYEDFVRDFDAAAPELLAACGLDWEPGCANFWESRRVIGTMSAVQARRPLEARASRAERYGDLLAPLKVALERVGVDLRTGEYLGKS